MNARLKVLHEKANVKSVKLLPTTVIGRSTECDLKIAASEVSRRHCQITVEDDAVFIEDLGSANGTFVNDQMLNPRERVAIDPGAKITIGPAEFIVDYIAPTSNTVVIHRTDKDGKPKPALSRNDPERDEKQIIFSSVPESSDVSSVEATIFTDSKENLATGQKENAPKKPQVPVQEVRSASPVEPVAEKVKDPRSPSAGAAPAAKAPAASQPVPATANPVVPKAKPAAAAPKPAVAVTAPAVSAPVAPPIAKAVSTTSNSSQPVAKAVPVAPKPAMPTTPAEQTTHYQFELEQPQPTTAVKVEKPDAPTAKAASSVATPARQFTIPELGAQALEHKESSEVFEEGSQFDFTGNQEPTAPAKPSSKEGKPGALKSLFSVFNRKASPGASSKESPSGTDAKPEHHDPSNESPVAPVEENSLSFGGSTTDAEATAESTEQPAADDDFQNFLRQF